MRITDFNIDIEQSLIQVIFHLRANFTYQKMLH